jgi:hypothetical protein
MSKTDGGLMERVRDELEAGASLDTVEHRVIDPTRLDEERRSALWLYAWAYETGREARRGRRAPGRFGGQRR